MDIKNLTPQDRFDLIMECRRSGLTDHQWLKEQGIAPSTFYNWIYAILLNFYRKSVRGRMVKNTVPVGGWNELDVLADPQEEGDAAGASVDGDIVRRAIESLSPEMREVLILHYLLQHLYG